MIEKRYSSEMDKNCYKCIADTINEKLYTDKKQIVDLLNEQHETIQKLKEKNKKLKQRNNNQYNQLTELWQIIEEENWEKLIAMKKQLKEDEERLQKEWKCYK